MPKKAKAPAPRSLATEFSQTIDAYIKNLPNLIAAEARFRPQSMQLDFDLHKQFTPQYLDFFNKTLSPRMDTADAASRRRSTSASLGMLQDFGAPLRSAMFNSDPRQAALVNTMTRHAQDNLANRGVTTRLRRDLQQDLRASQASRGTGYGLGDITAEGIMTGQMRLALEDRARQMAAQTANLRGDMSSPALGMITGSTAPSSQNYLMGLPSNIQQQAGLQMINPESSYAENLYTQQYAAANKRNMQNAQGANMLMSSGIQAVGNILGGAAAGRSGGGWFS